MSRHQKLKIKEIGELVVNEKAFLIEHNHILLLTLGMNVLEEYN